MPARWDTSLENELIRLVNLKQYTYKEIAEIMGLNRNQIAIKAGALDLKNPVYQTRITKHAHLREPVFKYFLNHTWEETRDHFNLTQIELKSLFTAGYKDPNFKHLRKNKRRQDSWSKDELMFLLKHSGIQPRDWISRKLKRGGMHSVKESLSRLNFASRYMNGMSRVWAVEVFGNDRVPQGIKTKAGPSEKTRGIDCRYRLIPWIICEQLAKTSKVESEIKKAISTMARFQRWIHGYKSDKYILKFIEKAAQRR